SAPSASASWTLGQWRCSLPGVGRRGQRSSASSPIGGTSTVTGQDRPSFEVVDAQRALEWGWVDRIGDYAIAAGLAAAPADGRWSLRQLGTPRQRYLSGRAPPTPWREYAASISPRLAELQTQADVRALVDTTIVDNVAIGVKPSAIIGRHVSPG